MSNVILLCFCIIYFGILFSFEAIRENGFGEKTRAVEVTEEYIRILDFKINDKIVKNLLDN